MSLTAAARRAPDLHGLLGVGEGTWKHIQVCVSWCMCLCMCVSACVCVCVCLYVPHGRCLQSSRPARVAGGWRGDLEAYPGVCVLVYVYVYV